MRACSRSALIISLAAAGLCLALILTLIPMPVSAWIPNENTWISNVDGNASDKTRWENGTVYKYQHIWFISEHNGNCTWDLSVPLTSLSLSGYQGSIELDGLMSFFDWDSQHNIPVPDDTIGPGPFDYINLSPSATLALIFVAAAVLFFIVLAIMIRGRRND